ncbi:MAG: T9SS type A sorting domain-containing protein [Candidatus Azobacteroides sp.]|nr:T9SS type A sorting domain-containing protein [Candidatus Azobacteroides sp.]
MKKNKLFCILLVVLFSFNGYSQVELVELPDNHPLFSGKLSYGKLDGKDVFYETISRLYDGGRSMGTVGAVFYDEDFNFIKEIKLDVPGLFSIMPFEVTCQDQDTPSVSSIKNSFFMEGVFSQNNELSFKVTLWDGEKHEVAFVNENSEIIWKRTVDNDFKSTSISTAYYNSSNKKLTFLLNVEKTDGTYVTELYTVDRTRIPANVKLIGSKERELVYPNPTKEFINIPYDLQGNKEGILRIFTLSGTEVKKMEVKGEDTQVKFSVSELLGATYLYVLETAGNTITSGKFIVK